MSSSLYGGTGKLRFLLCGPIVSVYC